MDRMGEITKATRYLRRKKHQRDQRRRLILTISSAIIGLILGIYAGIYLFI